MDLLCLDKALIGLIGSINYAGFAVMSLFGPRLSDLFGRKRVAMPGLVLCIISEALIIFISRNFYFTLTLIFFYGCSGAFRISLIYLYMMDMTPKKKQPLVGTAVHIVNGITSGMSVIYTRYIYYYWVPWQATILGLIIVATIAVVFIPESPKYLISKKKYDEARQVLFKMAKINGKSLTSFNINDIVFEAEVLEPDFNLKYMNKKAYDLNNSQVLNNDFRKSEILASSFKASASMINSQIGSPLRRVAEERKMTGSIKDLIRIKKHAINIVLLVYIWIQNTFCLTMINFYTKKIPGDTYSNMLANSLVEIPAYAIGGGLIFYLGMRITNYIGAAVALLGGALLIAYG